MAPGLIVHKFGDSPCQDFSSDFTHTHTHTYIYIYIYRERERERERAHKKVISGYFLRDLRFLRD